MQKNESTLSVKEKLMRKKWLFIGLSIICLVIIMFLFFSDQWFGKSSKHSKIYLQYIDRADRALINDSLETALQLYFKALDIDDRQSELYGKIAEAYFFAGMHHQKNSNNQMYSDMIKQTHSFLNQGMEINSLDPYFDYIRGLLSVDSKQPESAMNYFRFAESNGLKNFYLHLYLSDLYNEKEETALCLEHLLKAYELNPRDIRVLYNLGEIYYQIGHYEKAVKFQAELINLYPDNIDYKANYASSLWKSGDEKTAKNIFNQILESNVSKRVNRYNFVASTLIDRDIDYEWGIKVAKNYADLKENPISYDIMGWGYFKLKLYSEAVKYLTLSYNKKPSLETKQRLEMAQEKLKESGQ